MGRKEEVRKRNTLSPLLSITATVRFGRLEPSGLDGWNRQKSLTFDGWNDTLLAVGTVNRRHQHDDASSR